MLYSQQLVNGELVNPQESCVNHALRTFRERHCADKNPRIVRMIIAGRPIDHWYYRSEEFIDQPYFIACEWVQPFVGPASRIEARLPQFREFEPDESLMRNARRQ